MHYTKLGNTGLDVSRLCLGCMSFGEAHRGADSWTLGVDDSRTVIRSALDAGVNFFDTANVYSDGSSEEIVGQALRDHARRDEVVLATKVFGPMRSGPNSGGLSRKAILTEVENSLTRLGTDYIDLYQIHRWDPATPVEETLAALDVLVASGKVRYLGASSMYAWQFAKALSTADASGHPRFASMQNHYNLLNREEEREMLPLCADQRVAVMPWSPLARGRLARTVGATTNRTADDAFGDSLYAGSEEPDRRIVDAVAKVAGELGVNMASVALAWLLRNPVVVAPVIGVTKPHHLEDALKALDLSLTDDQVSELESPYVPHRVTGFE
ncbi:MAG: aldo/keto reductase [Umezawaea sp.]